jgi:hypothetical protein
LCQDGTAAEKAETGRKKNRTPFHGSNSVLLRK